jgi:hypothetical protein
LAFKNYFPFKKLLAFKNVLAFKAEEGDLFAWWQRMICRLDQFATRRMALQVP